MTKFWVCFVVFFFVLSLIWHRLLSNSLCSQEYFWTPKVFYLPSVRTWYMCPHAWPTVLFGGTRDWSRDLGRHFTKEVHLQPLKAPTLLVLWQGMGWVYTITKNCTWISQTEISFLTIMRLQVQGLWTTGSVSLECSMAFQCCLCVYLYINTFCEVWCLTLVVDSTGSRINWETHLWEGLWHCSLDWLADKGKPFPIRGSTFWDWVVINISALSASHWVPMLFLH